MAEHVKELIEKINREGVAAADDKARAIIDRANREADQTLARARVEADKIIAEANANAQKAEARGKALLAQAARDMLLELKGQIHDMLVTIIRTEVHQALTPEELARILRELVLQICNPQSETAAVSISPGDYEKLGAGFLAKLKEEARQGFTVHPAGDIHAGLRISFDAGQSHFDVSDQALADYIAGRLSPKLKEMLRD